MSAELPDRSAWLQESALERRYVTAIAIGLLAMLALVATNQRSIFTPWDPGANPLLTPSAFFAGPGRPLGGNRFVGNGIPRLPGLPGAPSSATPGGPPAGFAPTIEGDLPDVPIATLSDGDIPLAPGQSPFAGLPTGSDGSRGTSPPLATLTPVPPIGAVPEPTTWIMLVMGFMLLGLALRRARRTAATDRRTGPISPG